MKKTFFALFFAIFSLAVYAADIEELVVTTNPQLSCQNCENKIKGNLRFEKGIKKIETSIPEQRVTISYDADKTNPEKIEEAFAKIGYKIMVIDEDSQPQIKCEHCTDQQSDNKDKSNSSCCD
ncbi:MAG: heavy-metal-associated domain-containing protein [Muribaculaceae bacterium]|nr:heavy-metal-associated domain-containing protein [Muribaculaceae bacterium]